MSHVLHLLVRLSAAICCLALLCATPIKSAETDLLPRIPFGEVVTVCWRKIVQRTELPSAPEAVRVYEIHPSASRKAEMLALLRALPITDTPERNRKLKEIERVSDARIERYLADKDEASWRMSIEDWNVTFWPDGQFAAHYRLPDESMSIEDRPAPPEEQARAAAEAFLTSIRPLLPVDVQFADVSPCRTITSTHETVVSYWVSFRAEPEAYGLPVMGGVAVEVAAGPTVMTVSNRLPRKGPERMLPILTPEEAWQKLLAHDAHLADDGDGDTLYLDSVELMYYRTGMSRDAQFPYLVPVYVFSGASGYTQTDPRRNPEQDEWRAYVEAVRPEYLEE